MSRYVFSEMVVAITGAVPFKGDATDDSDGSVSYGDDDQVVMDCFGNETSIADWMRDGFVGWDRLLETYFLSIAIADNNPRFWYGTSFREIITPSVLCIIFRRLFNIPAIDIKWNEQFIEQLKRDRLNETVAMYDESSGARSEVEGHFAVYDEIMADSSNEYRVREEYLVSGVMDREDD